MKIWEIFLCFCLFLFSCCCFVDVVFWAFFGFFCFGLFICLILMNQSFLDNRKKKDEKVECLASRNILNLGT